MPQAERLARRMIHEGRTIKVTQDQIRLPWGQEVTRDLVMHPGAVVVLPVLPDGRIALVRQYRYPAEQELLEAVAGTLEPGEAPTLTAARELQEEAGYKAGHLEPLGAFYSAPGFCNEKLHLFLATDLTPSRLPGDDDERIDLELYTRAEAMALASRGEIQDAKTLAALLLWQLHGQRA